jgi:GT2 family glycosyltransferase
MTQRVSVIIPHFNDVSGLQACLEAIARQSLPPHEVIIADNASPQGEAAIQSAIAGRAKLTIVTERGAGPARNGGVRLATGDVFAFTDSDCLPDPAWLASGLSVLQAFDFIGGSVAVSVEDERQMTSTEAFERVFAFDNEGYVRRKGFTVTANLFCRRDVFEAVGGFRVGVPEDLEWCHRARDLGYRIGYAGAARVVHPARRSWDELTRKWVRLNAEALGIARGRPDWRLRWLARCLAMPISAVVHTPKPLLSRALERPVDRLKAVAMLYRLRTWRMIDGLKRLGTPA